MNKWLKRHPMSGWQWFQWVIFFIGVSVLNVAFATLLQLLWGPIRPVGERLGAASFLGACMTGIYYAFARKRMLP